MNVMERAEQSTLTSKGQVTIPKAIREYLGLKPGARVKFFKHANGSVAILPVRPASHLRGMLKSRLGRPVTIEEMNEAIAEGAADLPLRPRRR